MKLTNLLSVAYLTAATIVGTTSLAAMDAEFAGANLTTARLKGSEYKRQAVTAIPALAGTDTALLVATVGKAGALAEAAIQAYVDHVKAAVITEFDRVVDAVQPLAGAALFGAGVTAGPANGFADLNAGTAKVVFAALINGFTAAALAPHGAAVAADGSLAELGNCEGTINAAMAASLNAVVDLIAPGGDADIVLDPANAANFAAGGFAAAPLGVTRGNFKIWLQQAVSTR
jgi:hypothetical protein